MVVVVVENGGQTTKLDQSLLIKEAFKIRKRGAAFKMK